MLRQRCERWACKLKRCENLFTFTSNSLIFTSDINNFLPSLLWAELSIWALLIGEIECCRSPCSHANLPYLPPMRLSWDSRICPSDSCLSSCFQGVQMDETDQQSEEGGQLLHRKIITQTFLVHLQHHAAPLSPSALLLFDFFVRLVLSLAPVSTINELFICFPSFSALRAVFDWVQPIKDRNHHVWRGRWQQHPQRCLILACFALWAAAVCPRSHCLWECFTL